MSVSAEQLKNIAQEKGVSVVTQAAYEKASAGGYAVYFTKGPRVTKIEISGFFPEEIEGVLRIPIGERYCRVEARLDPLLPEEKLTESFGRLMEFMKTLPPFEKKRTNRALEERLAKEAGVVKIEMKPEEELALIERVAREMNVPVSQSAYERLGVKRA